jgi:hypothetical protein
VPEALVSALLSGWSGVVRANLGANSPFLALRSPKQVGTGKNSWFRAEGEFDLQVADLTGGFAARGCQPTRIFAEISELCSRRT